MPATARPLRIGILGAARIAPAAIIAPAAETGHRVVAIAARDPLRANAFAVEHGIERVHASYADLLSDPDVDAVYNPLANGLHGPWNLRAVAAGKHVLTEKPSAANAAEATAVRDAARSAGVVVMEGLHYAYHPLFDLVMELVADGAIGAVTRVESPMRMPAPPEEDPRWQWALAGGSTMDLGCYSLSALTRLGPLLGGEPRLVGATAAVRADRPEIDESLTAELAYPCGATGVAASTMTAAAFDFSLTIVGDAGRIHAPEFVRPQLDDRLVVQVGRTRRVEHLGTRSSYTYQLEAFAAAVREEAPLRTDADAAVRQAQWVDAVYVAAGLPVRQPTPV